ncbi:putative transmembrane protein 217B [Prionailurus viverrinus]|uniref:putative transmembrane protein 217B n=1 Tax=Prionailurus viverrinus TaxID=61388 RepID=UPI001FF57584|nr:putative transmembrane protein 217B [Prionailurus viverrinus]XP_047715373.1 putative transmembrane protein 217B [Prionailurus viverrinus]
MYKMNNKTFSLVVGIFSLLNTFQFLIFELNHTTYFGYEDKVSIYMDTKSELISWVMIHRRSINVVSSTITLVFSVLLLYCIRVNNYVGLLCYALWIIAYELISVSVIVIVNSIIKDEFKEVMYLHLIFQISRMLLHFLSLPFVTKYTYVLYKDPKISVKIGRHRHSSISTVDSWPPVGLRTLYRKLN